jgi:queuine tRNA-ribosyltransferase
MTADSTSEQGKLGGFEVLAEDGSARTGRLRTAHGPFSTPAFMPVATQGAVKGASPRELRELGAEILLSNTYHLHLRPGEETVAGLGGIHRFSGWDGPILTDSGGFQVFSLAKLRKVTPDGVRFQSHIDGAAVEFTPEKVVAIQERLGVDIAMVLDECLPYPCTIEQAEASLIITNSWAERSRTARGRAETLLFGIVQGGMFPELRRRAAEEILAMGFDGYAVGGVSVGEPIELMREIIDCTTEKLPKDKVRYLMGVGTPSDIVYAVGRGIDMFDCVIPTRSARFGRLFTAESFINIKNSEFRADPGPIDEGCGCYACSSFSRGFIAHLVHAGEILGVQLCTIHNIHFYQALMKRIRQEIGQGTFQTFSRNYLEARREQGAQRQ